MDVILRQVLLRPHELQKGVGAGQLELVTEPPTASTEVRGWTSLPFLGHCGQGNSVLVREQLKS